MSIRNWHFELDEADASGIQTGTCYHFFKTVLAGLFVAHLILISACSHITRRGQSPDDEGMQFSEGVEEPTYIGDIAAPLGLESMKVEGIGLVTDLDMTGSEPAPSSQRDYLIDEIKTHGVSDVAGLITGAENSMVLVGGLIPPGARKGDRFDLAVYCMPRSETTSLDGGYLMQTRLRPMMKTTRSVEKGHYFGVADGRVLVNSLFSSREEPQALVSGVIPGGGVVNRDRETGIVLASKSLKNATSMARAINARFTARVGHSPEGVANPTSDRMLEILIPDSYRHNVGRYFHVMLNIVFEESADQRANRLESLERQLHDPAMASLAAIRLEAIGEDAIGALKRGLRSEHVRVRFHAAEALAYMGHSEGLEVLRESVEIEPSYRWHGLTALKSLHNARAEEVLVSLFGAGSAEARCGAFQALRESMPGSHFVDGEFIRREFMLHEVPCDGEPMIHIAKSGSPEVVLFGLDQRVGEGFLYVDKGLTIRSLGPNQLQLQRYLTATETQRVVCSSRIEDLVRTACTMDCNFADVIRMIKEGVAQKAISSRLVINALPSFDQSYRQNEFLADDAAQGDADVRVARSDEALDNAEAKDKPKGLLGLFR